MKFDLRERIQKALKDASLTTCTRWAENRVVMPAPFRGPINFDRFPWQREILDIERGTITVMKAAQIGYSIAGMIRALYVLSERREDVLYVLPTQGLAGDFSKGRLDALVELSPQLRNLFKGGDSVGLKTTTERANLYIRGSVSSRGLVSVPVASAIIDEYDRCQDGTYDLVTERLSGQLNKYLFALSTPTLPEFGISKQHALGTMEEFFFKCPSCSKHITLRWPDNVIVCGDYPGDPESSKTQYICNECKAVLPHETKAEWLQGSAWVPAKPEVKGHRSFAISQMFSSTVTPEEMANASHKAELSEFAAIEFKNQKLGQAHMSEGARLTDQIIETCKIGGYTLGGERPEDSTRLICMGVDVGSFLDCWIAEFTFDRDPRNMPYENSTSKLLQATRIPSTDSNCWEQVGNLMREWQIRHASVDFQPDTVNARRFCRAFRGYATMVAYRRGTVGNEIKVTEDEQMVKCLTVDRTVFLDLALGRFHKGKIKIPGSIPGVVREHLKAPIRTFEIDDLGLPRGVYRSIADDHFAHASAYCEIAFMQAFTQSTGRTIQVGEGY